MGRSGGSPPSRGKGATKVDPYQQKMVIQGKNREQLGRARIKEMVSRYHSDEIGVVYLNAGQGDATIVRLPNGKVMVIDCNTDNSPENIVDYLKKAGIEKIDYLVITHPHLDHMSGTKEIASNFKVEEVWITKYRRKKESESQESYEKYKETYIDGLKLLRSKGTKMRNYYAKNEPVVEEGKLKIKVLGPSYSSKGKNEDIHEESMALQIKFGKTSMVFSGDTTNNGLDRIKTHYNIKNTTVWHASHHGSREGANEDALKEAKPKYTVIPVGKGNYHGHPHEEAKKIYRKNTEKKVYRTDEGNIGFRFNSKGESIQVQE